jgi:hypothetical protein
MTLFDIYDGGLECSDNMELVWEPDWCERSNGFVIKMHS